MRELVAELESRAATSAADGDAVIVADADGEHSLRELLRAADEVSTAVRDVAGPQATILVQADNSWRTVVAALAAGKLDGTLGLLSHHATRAEYDAACEDIDPAVVIASASGHRIPMARRCSTGGAAERGRRGRARVGTVAW